MGHFLRDGKTPQIQVSTKNQLYIELIKLSLGIIQRRKFIYSGYDNVI